MDSESLSLILAAIDDHAAAVRELAEAVRNETASREQVDEISMMDE